jgi:beta-ureidopropionase
MVRKQLKLIEQAAQSSAQIVCLQELSSTLYFCQVQDKAWFAMAEAVPNGKTIAMMSEAARRHRMVLIIPVFEIESPGVFYNTAAVLDADGKYLGKYRKAHIPHNDGFYEKYYFRPGNLGFPVFETQYARVGVYICYDRHFPEGARILGLAGAEVVFMPSATGGRSRSHWNLEQRSHAVANGYFVGTVNRVGKEPLGPLEFFGESYFADPMGEILAKGGSEEEIVVTDLNLDLISQARMELTFFRDRRPDAYAPLTDSSQPIANFAQTEQPTTGRGTG